MGQLLKNTWLPFSEIWQLQNISNWKRQWSTIIIHVLLLMRIFRYPDQYGSDYYPECTLMNWIQLKQLGNHRHHEIPQCIRIIKYSDAEINGHHFAESILKFIFLHENYFTLMQMSLNFVPTSALHKPALVLVMGWQEISNKQGLDMHDMPQPGVRPANDISIKFEIRSKLGAL